MADNSSTLTKNEDKISRDDVEIVLEHIITVSSHFKWYNYALNNKIMIIKYI